MQPASLGKALCSNRDESHNTTGGVLWTQQLWVAGGGKDEGMRRSLLRDEHRGVGRERAMGPAPRADAY